MVLKRSNTAQSANRGSAINFFLVKSLIMVLVGALAFHGFGQEIKRPKTIRWSEWSDSLAFYNGPIPLVQSTGHHSDSLSGVYGGLFYTIENEYYPIKSAGDYYLWFTRKYDFLFSGDVATYELYYLAGDDWSMAAFITENYKGKRFPIKISHYVASNSQSQDPKKKKLAKKRQQTEYDKNVSDPKKFSKTKNNN